MAYFMACTCLFMAHKTATGHDLMLLSIDKTGGSITWNEGEDKREDFMLKFTRYAVPE